MNGSPLKRMATNCHTQKEKEGFYYGEIFRRES